MVGGWARRMLRTRSVGAARSHRGGGGIAGISGRAGWVGDVGGRLRLRGHPRAGERAHSP